LFPHAADSRVNLYGSVPYLTGHNEDVDTSVTWMNAAETFVTIDDAVDSSKEYKNLGGTYASFLSESGTLEFFIFGSGISPHNVQRSLADITGYASMPPAFSLGFHFSKWDVSNSADKVITRNRKFSEHGFPVDVLWIDIDHTDGKRYFKFNQREFPLSQVEVLNTELREQ
jgi:alpha 1,3-glucosidase